MQGGNGAGLAFKPPLQVRVGGDMLGQHLDGDGTTKAGVSGLVDRAYATRAEWGVNLVGALRVLAPARPSRLLPTLRAVDRSSETSLFTSRPTSRDAHDLSMP